MKPICSICGRRTTPFVFIGREPVGPACARRLGLSRANAPKGVRFVAYKPARATREENLDLFEGVA